MIIPTASPQLKSCLVHLQQFRIHALIRRRGLSSYTTPSSLSFLSFSFRKKEQAAAEEAFLLSTCCDRFCAGFVTREISQASVGF
jgi:hypothetical protein